MVSLAHIDPAEPRARLRTARTNCRMTQEQAAKHGNFRGSITSAFAYGLLARSPCA
jgi:hypothetical protein